MSTKKSGSVKSVILVFISLAFIGINLQSLTFPIFASYGGQWARVRSGAAIDVNDRLFYPQIKLYLAITLVYIVVLFLLSWKTLGYIFIGKFRKFLKSYLVICTLPFVWSVLSFAVGFNYNKCNNPASFVCKNPNHRIIEKLSLHLIIVGLTLIYLKIITRTLDKNKTL